MVSLTAGAGTTTWAYSPTRGFLTAKTYADGKGMTYPRIHPPDACSSGAGSGASPPPTGTTMPETWPPSTTPMGRLRMSPTPMIARTAGRGYGRQRDALPQLYRRWAIDRGKLHAGSARRDEHRA